MADAEIQEQSQLELTLDGIEQLKLKEGQESSVESSMSTELSDADDDEQNEFLHSSTFLSNSQIIRTSNLNNTKSNNIVITSPTRPDAEKKQTKHKSHFQLFVSKESEQSTLNSDNDLEENDDEDEQEIEKETKVDTIHPRSSVTRSSSRKTTSSLKFIDIDDPSSTPKLPKMKPETTPWRTLRPRSTYSIRPESAPQKLPDPMSMNFIESLFDANTVEDAPSPPRSHSLFESGTSAGTDTASSSTTAHSTHELEHLRKQITNYKLQQRLLTELIRSIIKSSGNGEDIKNEIMIRLEKENGLLINEKFSLQKELDSKSTPAPSTTLEIDDARYNKKAKEVLELKDDLISTKNLNNELGSYIEELKSQLGSNSNLLNSLNSNKSTWEQLANDILTLLLDALEGDSATAILHARDKSNSIDTKLKVISLAVHEFLEKFDKISRNAVQSVFQPVDTNNENSIPNDLKSKIQDKLQVSKQIENDLKNLLLEQSTSFRVVKSEYESLKLQFNENLHFVTSLKKLLGEKRTKITELNDKISDLEGQLDDMFEIQQSNGQEKEAQLLKNRLNLVRLNHSKEVQRYEHEIDELRHTINDHKSHTEEKRLTEELLRKQREISDLNNNVASLTHQLSLRSKDSDDTIENLRSLLANSRSDYDLLQRDYNNIQQILKETEDELHLSDRDYKKKLEHAAKELNMAVTKQRTLLAEKSKLMFAFEDIKREKGNLTLNNNSLNEKITRLTYQVSSLSSYEQGFTSLYQLQVSYLKGLLESFGNVLEKSSITQAEQKLKKLFDPNIEYEQVHHISRTLFEYFENATASLIDDHSDLLLKFNDSGNEQLQEEIDKLTEELEWCYANGTFKTTDGSDNSDQTPRGKQRIDELERKRKAERERRKQEHLGFKARIKELEQENHNLKEKLKSSK